MRNLSTFLTILSFIPQLILAQSTVDVDDLKLKESTEDYLNGSLADVDGLAGSGDALPTEKATFDFNTVILNNSFEITNVPQVREYWFEFKAVTANPDGYERQIYTINGQFPAPLIEVNTGDTLRVHVTNSLDMPQTIHWHGISQNGTNVMDGVPGITQCPISPNGTFTYEFPIIEQYGTYWYHSHFANTMADGIAGPLIIHSPDDPLQRGTDYDSERILMITDWMHDQSTDIVAALKSPYGYRGARGAPRGDSVLINGVGKANCSDEWYPDGADCTELAPHEMPVIRGERTRFRIINTGAHSMLRVSIDLHEFEVVEVDTDPVHGPTLHEIPIAPAQRYSIIVHADEEKGKVGDKFRIRVNVAAGCMDKVRQEAFAILRYTTNNQQYVDGVLPDTPAWDDLAAYDSPCRDLDNLDIAYNITPRVPIPANERAIETKSLSSKFGTFLGVKGQNITGFAFNNISFQNQIWDPVLPRVINEGNYTNENIATVTFVEDGYVDLILNNLDGGIDHPYHLHGNEFQLIKRGNGNLTVDEWNAMNWTAIENPLRRDTIFIPGNAYAVLRIRTDNPGVWALHCHIGWHLAIGKMATMIVRPQDIQSFQQPEDWSGLCAGQNSTEEGPARRSLPESTTTPVEHLRSLREVKNRIVTRTGPKDI